MTTECRARSEHQSSYLAILHEHDTTPLASTSVAMEEFFILLQHLLSI